MNGKKVNFNFCSYSLKKVYTHIDETHWHGYAYRFFIREKKEETHISTENVLWK
jgi:hypothetical protein